MLCLHQLYPREHRAVRVRHDELPKIGPLWKLAHVVEPLPPPTTKLILRNEQDALLLLDGPFAETKG